MLNELPESVYVKDFPLAVTYVELFIADPG